MPEQPELDLGLPSGRMHRTEYERFVWGELPGTQVLYADEDLRVVVFTAEATIEQTEEAVAGWGFDNAEQADRCVYLVPGVLNTEHPRYYVIDPLAHPPVNSTSHGTLSFYELRQKLHLDGVLPLVVQWFRQQAVQPVELEVADEFGNVDSRKAALTGLFLMDQQVLKEVLTPEEISEFLASLSLQDRISSFLTGFGGVLNDLDTVDAKFEADGVKFYFNDWSDDDLLMVFSADGRHNDRENAKTVFDGDAYEWFDSDYTTPLKDALNYHSLSKEAWAAVGAALVAQGSEMENETDDGSEIVPVTAEHVTSHKDVEQCLLDVNSYNDTDSVVQAVEQAYYRASQDARENECSKSYLEAIEDVLGSKGVFEGNMLVFKLSYRLFNELLEGYLNENYEEFTYSRGESITQLVQYTEDKASVPDNFDAGPSDEDFSAAVLEMIHDL